MSLDTQRAIPYTEGMLSRTAMTRHEVERLRREVKRLFQERLKALEAAKERALQAADDLLLSLQGDESETHFPLFEQTPEPIKLIDAVIKIIKKYSGDFDINRIRDIIEAEYPGVKRPLNPTSISNTLKRLRESEILERVSEGQGRIPAVYRVPKQTANVVNQTEKEEDFDDLPVPTEYD